MEILKRIETRFQECVLLFATAFFLWSTLGAFQYIFFNNADAFIYFGQWGQKFFQKTFFYLGYVYFLIPVFSVQLAYILIRKCASLKDLSLHFSKILNSSIGFIFIMLCLCALSFVLDTHLGWNFSDVKIDGNFGGHFGNIVGGTLYTQLGLNGSLVSISSLVLFLGIFFYDVKLSDIFLSAGSAIKFTNNLFWNTLLKISQFIVKRLDALMMNFKFYYYLRQSHQASLNFEPVLEEEMEYLEQQEAINDYQSQVDVEASPTKNRKTKLRIAVDNTQEIDLNKIQKKSKAKTQPQEPIVEESLEDVVSDKDAQKEENLEEFHLEIKTWKKSYKIPTPNLLEKGKAAQKFSQLENTKQSQKVEECLEGFGLKGNVVALHRGVRLSMFEFEPGPGVKISKIQSLSNDLALSLGAPSIRILAPIPGKSTIGIEIPNEEFPTLQLGDLIQEVSKTKKYALPFALGKDVYGDVVIQDLSEMPHLLVSGTTGSGKSVFTNCFISSLLFSKSPKDLRFIMIDPKMIELTPYNGIPHLLKPVISDVDESKDALIWAEKEMDKRYKMFADVGARNIDSYNKKIKNLSSKSLERKLGKKLDYSLDHMPYIVIVIDELADLMITQGKEVERPITRIAQKARACGIHLLLATQRPSSEIVTGLIKTNFPSRIAFKVSSSIDSRTILDTSGAEKLLGNGDMLYMPNGKNIIRVQGAFVSEDEVNKLVSCIED